MFYTNKLLSKFSSFCCSSAISLVLFHRDTVYIYTQIYVLFVHIKYMCVYLCRLYGCLCTCKNTLYPNPPWSAVEEHCNVVVKGRPNIWSLFKPLYVFSHSHIFYGPLGSRTWLFMALELYNSSGSLFGAKQKPFWKVLHRTPQTVQHVLQRI